MRSKDILYSGGSNDECFTPPEAVKAIMQYIPKNKVVWLPFDTEESWFFKLFSKGGWQVERSHISEGKDFYTYSPKHFDVIVSNPPFTNKRKIFERALSFEKPFALIMSNTWLNDAAPKILFETKPLQLLMFRERMKFINNGIVENKITFSSSFFCYDLLPQQIIMDSLKKYKEG